MRRGVTSVVSKIEPFCSFRFGGSVRFTALVHVTCRVDPVRVRAAPCRSSTVEKIIKGVRPVGSL